MAIDQALNGLDRGRSRGRRCRVFPGARPGASRYAVRQGRALAPGRGANRRLERSVEFKFENVSAVLDELGIPSIRRPPSATRKSACPMAEMGHQRRFKRKPRTSIYPSDSGHVAVSHRSVTKSASARRGAADDGELRQAAGAAALVAADKRRRAIRLRSACRPHGAGGRSTPPPRLCEPGAHMGRR